MYCGTRVYISNISVLLCLQGDQNLTDKDLNKIYLDIGLQVFKQNVGWFAFHNSLNEFNYQNLIDAIFKNVDNLVPDKKNIDVNKYS